MIHFVTSIMFANECDVGWDPTMHLVRASRSKCTHAPLGELVRAYRSWGRLMRHHTKLRFHYNPLHDMESIWWIVSWILFSNRDKPIASEEDLEDAESQMQYVHLLFPRTL